MATVSPLTSSRVSLAAATAVRGHFDQIISLVDGAATEFAGAILDQVKASLPASFIEFDRAQRGDAVNHDLYGFDVENGVAIVQIRHAFRRSRRGYLNVHKSYVLVGRNEITNESFRHPVSASAVRAAIRKEPGNPIAPVHAAQRWMWGVTEKQRAEGIRQGDVLMVRERGEPKGKKIDARSVTLAGSHVVKAAEFIEGDNGRLYAFCPDVHHAKGQHDMISPNEEGWHSIRVAEEARAWDFSQRLGD